MYERSPNMNIGRLLFPDTLFADPFKGEGEGTTYLIEDPAYFSRWKYAKIKLAYMRACMKAYCTEHPDVVYIDHAEYPRFARSLKGMGKVVMYYPNDLLLKRRYESLAPSGRLEYVHALPSFLLDLEKDFPETLSSPIIRRHAAFYERMKDRFGILKGVSNQDKLNRKRLPSDAVLHRRPRYTDRFYGEAARYVFETFPDHPDSHATEQELVECLRLYPCTRRGAARQLRHFLKHHFDGFEYQDFVHRSEVFVNHSNLSCVLNNGLLEPLKVVKAAIAYRGASRIGMNNIEGFVRQVLGWREYMRYIYHRGGCDEAFLERLPNDKRVRLTEESGFWGPSESPSPLRVEYDKVMRYGYSHHIVRLMIFMNMMKLRGVRPSDMIEWFSCVHIDAYPWVMYSNVLAMGYFDKRFMTREYVSSSAYVLRNSNYKRGPWADEWDALYQEYKT